MTPVSGETVNLMSLFGLPEIPENTKVVGEVGGGYLLGEGRYNVEWLMFDDRMRTAGKSGRSRRN